MMVDRAIVIEIILNAVVTFLAAFLASKRAYRNSRKTRFYEERISVYSELAGMLPVADKLKSQSDYFKDEDGIAVGAAEKIPVIEARINAEKDRLKGLHDTKLINENRLEINRLEHLKSEHEEYLSNRKKLFELYDDFKDSEENTLRLFGSPDVIKWYEAFGVALENEYNTNIGVTTDDIVCNLNNLVSAMRDDLNSDI